MKKNGFTLIEMLIVLMIISTLLLITIPSITSNNKSVEGQSCKAMIKLTEAQVQAYKMEHDGTLPTLSNLVEGDYIEQDTCPGGEQLVIGADGTVKASQSPTS
ncbi:competence protein ComG [Pontibacillus halophilus JSM 076056 = DSM 19796]|uniref:ComG operon protein 3 n=1 Tax=Pontibacillus halophilus JSM 076056 = DSM 19796 TaxID=1385510 RepID=A0A0A5GI36_9BACI|nr:competence type IV pilus major pilin ComGC [Pontibacillus halophilus]KGX90878.1 competence protein ComG [Pontibacillus halophilus JSM 076056 = DSM 19796]